MNVNVSEYISCDVNECIIGFVVDSFLYLSLLQLPHNQSSYIEKQWKSNVQEKVSCVLCYKKENHRYQIT